MPQQVTTAVENNFTKGLVTEFTGLNFPENSATDTDNCKYSLIGDVTRRLGIDFEPNFSSRVQDRTGCAITTYKWNNAGGDGNTQIVVEQVGDIISFYKSSTASEASPLSTQLLGSIVWLFGFKAPGVTLDLTKEAEFSDGNGYLFIYHPDCDPIYCTYVAGVITGNRIDVKVRDFTGVIDDLPVNVRPSTLSNPHLYNLGNQGWTQGGAWYASGSTSWIPATGAIAFTVAAGILGINPGDNVVLYGTGVPTVAFGENTYVGYGNVTSYVGTTLTLNVVGINTTWITYGGTVTDVSVSPTNAGYLGTWNTEVGGYPSNADVWWYFKNASNVFNPGTTLGNVTLNTGNAPRGHFILSAFDQQRDVVSAVSGITDVTTSRRPRTGAWFQGRVWFTGVDSSQAASGTANYTTWTESIYFSQIVNEVTQLGNCYQTNDPTSQDLFDLLPTDGGVIQIQGCGSIYKLFPIQNGMLVFAANGVWFITGSQGIGFSANDYTITKLSSNGSISSSSFVDVQGLPYFWNEDGIYSVQPKQGGGLEISSVTVGTIQTFYDEIPTTSKKYVKGAYDPIEYVIQWVYKSEEETSVTSRYSFDKILNFNTYNKSFYPYTLDISFPERACINGIIYVTGQGGSSSIDSSIKYVCSNFTSSCNILFAEEYREDFTDWVTEAAALGFEIAPYESYLVTGYKVHGQAQKRFQIPYIYVFSRTDGNSVSYKIQGMWDYATSGNSGRWSTSQIATIWAPNYGMTFKRHKIRGQGLVLQLKFKSVAGEPFDFMGWSTFETVNTGV